LPRHKPLARACIVAKQSLKEKPKHVCIEPGCEADISHKHGNAKRCDACAILARRERDHRYAQLPEVKQAKLASRQRLEVKQAKGEYQRRRRQRPEVKQAHREYERRRRQRPEVKQAKREYERLRRQRPEVKQAQREYERRIKREKKLALLIQKLKEFECKRPSPSTEA
jgi:hypothetical protein